MIRLLTVLAALLIASTPAAAAAEASIPTTPAGHIFSDWLSIANDHDREAMAAFIKKYSWPMDIDQEMAVLQQHGGYSTVAVEQSELEALAVRVKTLSDGAEFIFKLDISKSQPRKILLFGPYEAPRGTSFVPYKIDAKTNRSLVTKIASAIRDTYFDRAAGERIAKSIIEKAKSGAYDQYVAAEILAEAVNEYLHDISHDQHLNVLFYLVPPLDSGVRDPQQFRIGLARHNCGFVRAEHIAPNIGYLKFDSFASPDACGETANAAMRFVADSDAIIFDLRDNGGGVPAMVSYLESFLFDKATHLNDVYFRKGDETHQFWTLPYVQGKRVAKSPLFVLTSKNTFSAAEEFAYTLQSLKRATIVGETTGGGAHPYDTVKIDSNFTIEVPFARSINPVTKSDWESTGVIPDVKVTAADALERAISLAKAPK
jgi:Peptidase family S41